MASKMNILDLPDCVLELVMSYLSYDDIAKSRPVSEYKVSKVLSHKFYISRSARK